MTTNACVKLNVSIFQNVMAKLKEKCRFKYKCYVLQWIHSLIFFDRHVHCDGQKGFHIHLVCQRNVFFFTVTVMEPFGWKIEQFALWLISRNLHFIAPSPLYWYKSSTDQNCLYFMHFYETLYKTSPPQEGRLPLLWKILDLPLHLLTVKISFHNTY